MKIRAKAFLFSILAVLIFSSCNNFFHDLIPNSENNISSFRVKDINGIDVTESTVIDGSNISIKVKAGSDVSKLIPNITASEKSTVIPMTVGYIHSAAPSVNLVNFAVEMQKSRTSGDLASWALNFAQKTPDFHVPDLSLPVDFRTVVPVAVIAGDGNTKIYQVTVEHGEVLDENGEPLPDQGQKEIVAFSVEGQEGESEIDESGVTFTMAEGQDIRALIPHVEVSQGATFLPFTQDYLLKYVDFQDFISLMSGYSIIEETDKAERFLASWLRKNNISLSGELDTPIDFSDTVQFIVQAADGSVKLVPVRCVTLISEMPKLSSWVFTKLSNENLVRDSETDFSFTTFAEVEIVFPYDYLKDNEEKDESFRLVPSFTMDADRAEFSMDDGATWQDLVSSETVIPFTAIKKDCKIRVWKGTKSADYILSLSYTEDPDTIRSITDFRFPKSKNTAIKATALATIVDDGDVGTITISVVYNAGDEAAVETLTSTFVSPGTVYNASDSKITSGCGFYGYGYDPEHPEIRKTTLTCVSRNGMYRRVYSVTIKFVEVQPAVAAMRTFTFPALLNPSLAGDAVGIINDSNQTILVNAVYRTAEKPSRLVAEFTSTGNVDADGIPQSSGYSGSDFRYARNYTVTASDDPSVKKTYRVQVSFRYDTSMACSLDSMVFRAADNPTLSKDVEVSISQSGLKGTAFLPYGTDSWNTALIPTFEAQGKVSVNGVPQTSGVDSWNFSDDVIYTVESADKSVRKDYTIHVTETGSIIYVDCRAQGRGDGSSWENAFTTVTAAGETLDTLPDGSSVEVWIADVDNRDYSYFDGKFTNSDWCNLEWDKPETSLAVRAGFSGTETSPDERNVNLMNARDIYHSQQAPSITITGNLKSILFDGLMEYGIWAEQNTTTWAMIPSKIDEVRIINCGYGGSAHRCMDIIADSLYIEDSYFVSDTHPYSQINTIIAKNSHVSGYGFIHCNYEAHFENCTNIYDKYRDGHSRFSGEDNCKWFFKDCDFGSIEYEGSGELSFENCLVGVYDKEKDVSERELFTSRSGFSCEKESGGVNLTIKDSKFSINDDSYKLSMSINSLNASSSVINLSKNLTSPNQMALNLEDCKILAGYGDIRCSSAEKGTCSITNCEFFEIGPWLSHTKGSFCHFSGFDSVIIKDSKLGSFRCDADNLSVSTCELKSFSSTCTKSVSLTNNTFLNTNTEGETCVNIKAPSSLTFENNEFEKWGIVELSTEGHLDFKDFTLKQQDAKMRFGLEMGSGSYDLQDWNCEYQYVKTGAGTNLTATDCVIYETLEAKENCTFELSGCRLGVKNLTETSEYRKVDSLKVGSDSTVTAENCTMDGNITGSGNLSFSGCTIKGNISGGNISTHNATGIEGTVEGSQDVSLDGGQVTSAVTAHGNLTLSGSVIVGGDVTGYSNATFNPGTQIKGNCSMLDNNKKLTASNTTILKGLTAKGTVQMTGCNLCSSEGHINTEGNGWATFTSCTINRNIWGDGTTATGCVIYGAIYDNSPSSVFRSCNLTGEDAYVSSRYCGTMQGCEFNGLFYSDRIRYSTGTFDGCWFNPAEGSSLTGITVSCGATVRNMTFYRHGDTAIDVRDGDSSRTTTIENCKFLANSSTGRSGAGVLIVTGNAHVKDCVFVENYSKYSGGGIAYIVDEPRWCTLENCLFVNNSCDPAGKDAYANGPSGSGVNLWNTSVSANIFDIWSKFCKAGDISAGLPGMTVDYRHAADFL